MPENTFKTRLRTARKMRGMSQEDLAKAASIKQPSLSALETGAGRRTSPERSSWLSPKP